MGLIRIIDHVNQCYSNNDGEVIFRLISANFNQGEKVIVSFRDIDSASSSFINSAFIDFLETYSFDFIKTNLIFVDSNKTINDVIKRRFSFEVNNRKKLVSI